MAASGSLACVGIGMLLGGHMSPRARSHVEHADVVFAAVSDPLVELWLQQLRPDLRSLQPLYSDAKPRQQTYREMVSALLLEVRSGRRVCAVFYGHPGVFAQAPHAAVSQAREEGFEAVMEPGISAADCLYADLGIDPGQFGCQHFEATQFMLYRRIIDRSAHLVLWQVGLAGDRSYRRRGTGVAHRQLLLERLIEDYPATHQVIVYEAATLPIASARIDRVALHDLPGTDLHMHSTLVLPPCQPLQPDHAMLARIAALESGEVNRAGPAHHHEEATHVERHPVA
jgi:uncharacterized protein YabN with tetrapyrrole methylase and pyrophosphatase domain